MDKFVTTMKNSLHDLNTNTNRPLDIFLFKEAVTHLVRLVRIIKNPGGNALLFGVEGVG